MGLLVTNASGTAANTNGNAPAYFNPDPAFVERNLLNTVYVWATTWDSAEIQLYIAPQHQGSSYPTIWMPLGGVLTSNQFYSFAHRWAQIKAEVVNASALTVGLTGLIFDGL